MTKMNWDRVKRENEQKPRVWKRYWVDLPPTPKQIRYIADLSERLGREPIVPGTRGDATDLIDVLRFRLGWDKPDEREG